MRVKYLRLGYWGRNNLHLSGTILRHLALISSMENALTLSNDTAGVTPLLRLQAESQLFKCSVRRLLKNNMQKQHGGPK